MSDVGNPMKLAWRSERMDFRVVEATGRELRRATGPYDGLAFIMQDLVLPFDSTLSFNISCRGLRVSGDKAALIDLGPPNCWTIEPGGKGYYLEAALEIPQCKRDPEDATRPWHGRVELPRVRIPLEAPQVDQARIEELIRELGTAMLGKDATASEKAVRSLSMIDDERVVPWYLKAMETHSYGLKFTALDRLARFESDEALRGLKRGMTTRGADIGNCTTDAVAAQMAENIRYAAAGALSRSPHPDAKRLLLSMWNDPSPAVRITVLHALGKMDSEESLELLKRMTEDPDESVRKEAQRYLKLR